jgi:hypothetical protein
MNIVIDFSKISEKAKTEARVFFKKDSLLNKASRIHEPQTSLTAKLLVIEYIYPSTTMQK